MSQLADPVRGRQRLAAELRPPEGWCRLEQAVVAAVDVGAAADGNDLVTVTWRGDDHAAAYHDHYTPVVGHTVTVAVQAPAGLLILGHAVGTPPAS